MRFKYFDRSYNLPRHRVTYWKCDVCNIEFKTVKQMDYHLNVIHNMKVRPRLQKQENVR